MKRRKFLFLRLSWAKVFLVFGSLALTGAYASDPPAALKKWTDRIIPLPQMIETAGSIRISPRDVSLSLPGGESPLLLAAGDLLRPLAAGSGFEIKGALAGGEIPADLREALRSAPNSDQAYAIRPLLREQRFQGLLLAANTPLGLLYAARALRQLVPLGPFSESLLEIPRITILDWPDLAERKLNAVEVHAQLGFNDDGSPKASLSPSLMEEAGRRGIAIVPIILHMEQLAGTGLFRYHPEVAAVPEPGRPLPTDYTPPVCFSQPKTAELLSGWMDLLLGVLGVEEVDVWLSEETNRCYCPLCAGEEPFVLETKGILRAFAMTRRLRLEARLRILLTQASHDVNDKVLAVVGREAKVIYYDGGRTYDSSHKPMIEPGSLSESLARMEFGRDLLAEFETERSFEADRESVRRVLVLARKIGDPAVLAETESLAGVLDLLAHLREISAARALPDEAARRESLGRAMDGLDRTARSLAGSLGRWGRAVHPVPRNRLASRFRDTVDFAAHLADAERSSHAAIGWPDPFPSFRNRPVARWKDEDFARSETAELWADVTEAVAGPGEYDVTFRFEDGASGLKTRAVTLLRGPDQARAKPVSEDRWDFRIGRFDRYIDYWLTVPDRAAGSEAADRFFLKLEITGPAVDAPADRRTCRGLVTMRRSWRE